MVDINSALAKLRAKRAAEANQTAEVTNAQTQVAEIKEAVITPPVAQEVKAPAPENKPAVSSSETKSIVTSNAVATIGTERTSEIDHMQFMSQMEELATAIHTQHPKMPVLLMM